MLLSGIRTPLGIKLYGKTPEGLEKAAKLIEAKLRAFDKSASVFADQASTGYFLNIEPKAQSLQRYGMSKDEVMEYVSLAVGGMKISTLYDGLERYPITLRLEEDERRSLDAMKSILIKTKKGFVPLGTLADLSYAQSASVIKSEMAAPVVFISISPKDGVTPREYKQEAQKILSEIKLESGYRFEWAGQSEYLESAMNKIIWIVPLVLLSILLLIYFALKELVATLIVFFTLPFALFGGLIYIDMLGFSMSIAVIVGFLALLGVAAETAIVMIVYLQESIDEAKIKKASPLSRADLNEAIYEGAVQRLRPKLMTVFAILAGLAPIMYTNGVGSEVMQRIAAPMLGGIVTSAILSLVIIPILIEIYHSKDVKNV